MIKLLLYDQLNLRRGFLENQFTTNQEVNLIYSCLDREEIIEGLDESEVDVILAYYNNLYYVTYPLAIPSQFEHVKILNVIPREFDNATRKFVRVSAQSYISSFDPDFEVLVSNLRDIAADNIKINSFL